jgi:hypothetical protein
MVKGTGGGDPKTRKTLENREFITPVGRHKTLGSPIKKVSAVSLKL